MQLIILEGCNSSKEDSEDNNGQNFIRFHADNDIAMTVKSLVDAIKVGEEIDSVAYDFTGILTDGQGSPLYTNLQGYPGVWVVDVIDSGNVTIRNLDLGDLLPNDLEAYLLSCLHLEKSSKIEMTTRDAMEYDDTEISVYDFGGGFLRIEKRLSEGPNGLQCSLMTIGVSTTIPKGVETQTSV